MESATLIVRRLSTEELLFTLRLGQVTAFIEARHRLSQDQYRNISHELAQFAAGRGEGSGDEADLASLARSFFQQIFPQIIREHIRDLTAPLTLLTDDPTLPWEILHDGTDFLAVRLPMARQLILRQNLGGLLSPGTGADLQPQPSALVIADPTGDLPGALAEGEAVCKFFAERGMPCDFFAGAEVTWGRIHRQLVAQPYAIIHYCGHVDYDPERRTSSMRLHGNRLAADEVLAVFRGSPIVFLNACYSDTYSEALSARPEVEGLGCTESFAQAFMVGNEQGVASAVVGAMWNVPDEPECIGRDFALAFYHGLLAGEPIGKALQSCRLLARERSWGPMAWGPYVLYGDTDLRPFRAAKIQLEDGGADTAAGDGDAGHAKRTEPTPGLDDFSTAGAEVEGADIPALDTSARRVFHAALREARQGEQAGLGSVHLLLGFCEVRFAPLVDALEEQGVQPDEIRDEARRRAALLVRTHGEGFGISTSVAAVLRDGMRRAAGRAASTITGEDLLASLLRRPCTAAAILKAKGVPLARILSQLGDLRLGPLGAKDCTPDAWQVLRTAAAVAGGGLLATPHLFAAMLQDEAGPLRQALRRLGVVTDNLPALPGIQSGSGGSEAWVECSANVHQILLSARADAEVDGRHRVTRRDLLKAFVAQGGGGTGRGLRRAGLTMEALGSDLFLDGGELDLGRFDADARRLLDRAVDCARRKGAEILHRHHLIHALLSEPEGQLARRLASQGQDAERLADLLFVMMASGASGASRVEARIRCMGPDLVKVLCAAEAEARAQGPGQTIGEAQVLAACVRDGGGGAGRLLVERGVAWSRLL